ATSHVVGWEEAAAAFLAGVQLRGVATPDGILTAELVAGAIRPGGRFQPRTSLICVENTHNAAGGKIMPIEELRAIRRLALERGCPFTWTAPGSGTPVPRPGSPSPTTPPRPIP